MAQVIDSFNGQYRFLSNFYPAFPISFNGWNCATVEHAYQAAKTSSPYLQKKLAHAATPGMAKRFGRQVILRPNWDTIKFDYMRDFCLQKFSREPLRSQLIATGDSDLIEGNTWGDTVWGVYNGVGQNHLGRILMQIRGKLQGDQNVG